MRNSRFPTQGDYKSASLSKLRIGDEKMRVISAWMKDPKDFLILLGNPGSQKTYFCAALHHYLNDMKKVNVIIREYDLFAGLRDCMNNGNGIEFEMEKLGEYDFLIIDDLGTCTDNDREWRRQMLGQLIDSRYNSRLPTVITSNLYVSDMRNSYDDRIYSRLTDKRNTIIELSLPDIRQEDRD